MEIKAQSVILEICDLQINPFWLPQILKSSCTVSALSNLQFSYGTGCQTSWDIRTIQNPVKNWAQVDLLKSKSLILWYNQMKLTSKSFQAVGRTDLWIPDQLSFFSSSRGKKGNKVYNTRVWPKLSLSTAHVKAFLSHSYKYRFYSHAQTQTFPTLEV